MEIDAVTMRIARRWSTEPCKQPISMAIDAKNHRLFSGCRSGVLAVSDYVTGKVITTVPIGMGNDGIAYDAASGNLFASNSDGTLSVIHQESPDRYVVSATVATAQGSRNVGLDTLSHRLFLPAADFAASAGDSRRAPIVSGTFRLLVIEAR